MGRVHGLNKVLIRAFGLDSLPRLEPQAPLLSYLMSGPDLDAGCIHKPTVSPHPYRETT